MATVIRAAVSESSKYYVEKHRYYELKHFCLQYPIWKRLYRETDGFQRTSDDPVVFSKSNTPSDPTYKCVEQRMLYFKRMELVEQTAFAADPDLAQYVLKGVTEELSYGTLKTRLAIPCGKDTYYDRYRRFFWLLDKVRE